MLVDNLLIPSGGIAADGTRTYQTVTGASAVLSTNSIDLSTARDIGEAEIQIYARFQVGTVFAGLTALNIEVVVADDAALTTNVTPVGGCGNVAVANLTAGARLSCMINPSIQGKGRRYLGFRYTPTGTGTTGTLFGDIGFDLQDGVGGNKSYPSGFSII